MVSNLLAWVTVNEDTNNSWFDDHMDSQVEVMAIIALQDKAIIMLSVV